MANDYLVGKWKIWYRALDVNNDGTISLADVEDSRQKFVTLNKLDAEMAKKVGVNIENWWESYIFKGRKGDISESNFVDDLNKEYVSDKEKFKKEMETCFKTIFGVLDTNKDESISEEEFQKAFQAYGHENVASNSKFFGRFEASSDGMVPLSTIVAAWTEFMTGSDASKLDVVKEAFDQHEKEK